MERISYYVVECDGRYLNSDWDWTDHLHDAMPFRLLGAARGLCDRIECGTVYEVQVTYELKRAA
jgi:hypothetical protein